MCILDKRLTSDRPGWQGWQGCATRATSRRVLVIDPLHCLCVTWWCAELLMSTHSHGGCASAYMHTCVDCNNFQGLSRRCSQNPSGWAFDCWGCFFAVRHHLLLSTNSHVWGALGQHDNSLLNSTSSCKHPSHLSNSLIVWLFVSFMSRVLCLHCQVLACTVQ